MNHSVKQPHRRTERIGLSLYLSGAVSNNAAIKYLCFSVLLCFGFEDKIKILIDLYSREKIKLCVTFFHSVVVVPE